MSDMKLKDLSPVPFFAHFLEGQFARDLTAEEMNAIRGGMMVSTMAIGEEHDSIPLRYLPDQQALLRRVNEQLGQLPTIPFPGTYVTQAYPSDQENVPL